MGTYLGGNILNKKTFSQAILMLTTTVLLACHTSSVIPTNKELSKEDYVKDELIAKFKEGATEVRIKEIISSLGCEIIRSIGSTKTFLIKIKTGEDVEEMMGKYRQFDEVEYAQPNYVYHTLEGK